MKKSAKPKKERHTTRLSRFRKRYKDPLGGDWRPGTPSKYDPKFCDDIIIASRKGWTFEEFASHINVCLDTLYDWAERYPEFGLAKKRAKQESLIWWMKIGRKAMLGYQFGPKFGKRRSLNPTLWIFTMKARFGWSEENEESDDGDVDFEFE